MLRVTVREGGQGELPAIDVDATVVEIGSGASAHVRLPAGVAEPTHVRVMGGRWTAVAPVAIVDDAGGSAHDARDIGDGASARDTGNIGDGVTLAIGSYQVRIAPAPPGAVATPPQRTESLARELMRSLLGDGAAPSLEMERGPVVGARKTLAPPDSTLVIGRGDEAGWILIDEDLSRAHAEVQRSWDGIRIADLDSKNGTRIDGVAVGREGALLHHGALVELGKVALRFRDPAEAHLGGPAARRSISTTARRAIATPTTAGAAATATSASPATTPAGAAAGARTRAVPAAAAAASMVPFYIALGIMLAALASLVWVLSW